VVAGSDEHRRAARGRHALDGAVHRLDVGFLAVEQVTGDEDGVDAPGDGLVDGAAPDLAQLEAPGGSPLGR
jgi:hypothetical protein